MTNQNKQERVDWEEFDKAAVELLEKFNLANAFYLRRPLEKHYEYPYPGFYVLRKRFSEITQKAVEAERERLAEEIKKKKRKISQNKGGFYIQLGGGKRLVAETREKLFGAKEHYNQALEDIKEDIKNVPTPTQDN